MRQQDSDSRMQQERVAIDALFGLVDAECSLRSLLKKLNV